MGQSFAKSDDSKLFSCWSSSDGEKVQIRGKRKVMGVVECIQDTEKEIKEKKMRLKEIRRNQRNLDETVETGKRLLDENEKSKCLIFAVERLYEFLDVETLLMLDSVCRSLSYVVQNLQSIWEPLCRDMCLINTTGVKIKNWKKVYSFLKKSQKDKPELIWMESRKHPELFEAGQFLAKQSNQVIPIHHDGLAILKKVKLLFQNEATCKIMLFWGTIPHWSFPSKFPYANLTLTDWKEHQYRPSKSRCHKYPIFFLSPENSLSCTGKSAHSILGNSGNIVFASPNDEPLNDIHVYGFFLPKNFYELDPQVFP